MFLYEKSFLSLNDVKLMQKWLQFLIDIDYTFPNVKEYSQLQEMHKSVDLGVFVDVDVHQDHINKHHARNDGNATPNTAGSSEKISKSTANLPNFS